MLNYIWAFMIIIGILYGCLTGNMAALSNAALDSAKEAVSLCITMLGVMSLWVGLMQIAQKSGLIAAMTQKLGPLLRLLFPRLDPESKAMEYISTNVIANILGLGWACTPAGLKAMEELKKIQEQRAQCDYYHADQQTSRQHGLADRSGTDNFKCNRHIDLSAASNEMCNFLILNISSLQLIPVNIIVYRSQYGSVNPTAIILPAIIATSFSTLAGILFIKLADRNSTKSLKPKY